MDRSERRRQERDERKASQRVNGIGKAYLARADADLSDSVPDALPDEHASDFAVLLSDWAGTNQACTELKLTYQRVQELLKRGRKGLELAPIREKYAGLLEERDVIESQMLDILNDCEAQERDLILANPHIHLARGTTHRVTEELRDRLLDAIEAREVHGKAADQSPDGGTSVTSPAAAGQPAGA